jgi:GT2 family glycosyltransferase
VGVRLSSGDVVLFVDDDIIPDRDLVKAHAAGYKDPAIGGVGGRIRGGYDAVGAGVGEFRPAEGVVVRNFSSCERREVDHLPGGNMSFRREVFDAVGGFDRAYGGSAIGEETDFCLRARRKGVRLLFEPGAAIEHLHLPTGGCREAQFSSWLYWHAHNGMLFTLRYAWAVGWPFFVLKRVARFALFAIEHGSPTLLATGLRGLVRGMATHAQRA